MENHKKNTTTAFFIFLFGLLTIFLTTFLFVATILLFNWASIIVENNFRFTVFTIAFALLVITPVIAALKLSAGYFKHKRLLEEKIKKIEQEEKFNNDNSALREKAIYWENFNSLVDKLTEKREEVSEEEGKDIRTTKIKLRKDFIETIKEIKQKYDQLIKQ